MREIQLRKIAEEFLVPFFSGSSLQYDPEPSTRTDRLVEQINDKAIAFKISTSDSYRLVLQRRQQFSKEADVIPEISIVEAFVDVLAGMGDAITGEFQRDLLATFQRRIVARSIAASRGDEDIILDAIDQLARLANRLYEGQPISASLGFRHKIIDSEEPIEFDDFWEEDYSAVLSNGHDTILEFNFSGEFVGHHSLDSGKPASYCPLRQTPIAEWTTESERRVAMTLNRLGEILIFRDQQLLFARRSGRWCFLTHRPIITQMGTFIDRDIREVIYTSCIDASFARTGACIGVLNSKFLNTFDVINRDDYLLHGNSRKAQAIHQIVAGKKFQELDRRLRQELLAIDGATVLAVDGDIFAVGAILKIKAGSSGGGRLAAAKTLSEFGLGIKVSQDGGITGFRDGRDEPSFKLM